MMDIDCSIIICTRNRKGSLLKAMESLQKLNVSGTLAYEILIIDNGSDDGTMNLVESFVKLDPDRWKYHFEPKKGLSNARNSGVKLARGNIIAFTDDDVIVDGAWIQRIWETFKANPDIIAVQGKIILQEQIKHLPPWVDPEDLLFCCVCYNLGPTAKYTDALVGANMAFRKETFAKYGFFDARLGAGASGLSEETEYCERLKEAGEKIMYEPDALVLHEFDENRFTWEYWCQRIQQQAHGNAITDVLLRQKKTRHLRNRRKLLYYHIKYCLYTLQGNNRKKYKYYKKIRYMKCYVNYVSKFVEKRR